jgi:hypothetical protein
MKTSKRLECPKSAQIPQIKKENRINPIPLVFLPPATLAERLWQSAGVRTLAKRWKRANS